MFLCLTLIVVSYPIGGGNSLVPKCLLVLPALLLTAFEKFMSKKVIKWHDLIGLTLTDFFKGSNFEVKTEQNMSVKPQYVDVLIISKSSGKPIDKLPDGFEFLTDYNILTYKSLDQILNQWAIVEVLGHYVSYRKIVSPKNELLPESKFQVFAV